MSLRRFRDGIRDDRIVSITAGFDNSVLIGYARVSTRAQDHQAQLDALAAAHCREIVVETASTREARPKLRNTLDGLHSGDTLVIYKPDRVARSMKELLVRLQQFKLKLAANVFNLSCQLSVRQSRGCRASAWQGPPACWHSPGMDGQQAQPGDGSNLCPNGWLRVVAPAAMLGARGGLRIRCTALGPAERGPFVHLPDIPPP